MPTPYDGGAASSVPRSGVTAIDGLLGGVKWGGPAGSATAVSYSFPGADAVWSTDPVLGYGSPSSGGEPWYAGYGPLSAGQQAAFAAALASWSEVANITFVPVADTPASVGDIRAAQSGLVDRWGAVAWAYYPRSATPYAGDIWLNPYEPTNLNPLPGSYGFATLVHEIGHAIGLKHPFDGRPTLARAQSTEQYTVMAYAPHPYATIHPAGPMLYDIAAVQYLYGPNMATRAGDDTYTFSASEEELRAIWDAGGNDTFDLSNQPLAVRINLNAGAFSSIGVRADGVPARDNVAIAFGATIENAIGGAGNDVLIGNAAANRLDGGPGADTMTGGAGNDTYVVDNAGDRVVETSGGGTDTIESWMSVSLAQLAYVENVVLKGAADLAATGNSLANILVGNSGANVLSGGGGNDVLVGGAGNDTLVGGPGNDLLDGGPGRDTLDVSQGNDIVRFSAWDTHDIVLGFDASPAGGQDFLDLDFLFDSLGFGTAERQAGAGFTVLNRSELWVDADNNNATGANGGFELQLAAVSVVSGVFDAADVLPGTA